MSTVAGSILAISDTVALPSGGLLLGLMLVAGLVGGYVARMARVPRVVGYLVAGLALKGVVVWLAGQRIGMAEAATAAAVVADGLRPVTYLALGMILFNIGGVFESRHLRAVGGRVLRISLAEAGLTAALVLVGVAVAGFAVLRAPAYEVAAFALLLSVAAVATAPAATLLVLREYQAKGPMTDSTLTLVGLNNVLSIVLFHVFFVVLAASGVVAAPELAGRGVWIDLLMTTVGSVLLGCVVGLVISLLHGALAVSETLLVFLAVMIGLGAGRDWLADPAHLDFSYNFLLTCLVAGAVFSNLAVDPERLGQLLATIGVPIFAAFFVLAGYNLHLAQVVGLGPVGLAYVVFRVLGKLIGGRIGSRWVAQPSNIHQTIGLGLLCQAGVAIGLAEFLRDHWMSPLAGQFYTIILGSVVLFELVGPVALKWTSLRSGEVQAVTLLRRARPAWAEGFSSSRLVLGSMARMFRPRRRAGPTTAKPLRVKDIMRTNVRFLRPDAGLDDVLHFVEASRFNHFPVVGDGNQLLGVIDFEDIRDIIYDPLLSDLVTAMDLAKPDSAVVGENVALTELLELFRKHNLGCMPVVAEPGRLRVVGLVEQRDLLRALHLSRDEARL